MINIIISSPSGGVFQTKCEPESSITELLAYQNISMPSKGVLFLDGEIVDQSNLNKNNIFKDGSRLIFTSSGRGAAPTPNYRKVSQFLFSQGYKKGGGKGDHAKFTNAEGYIVVLNTDKRDKKCIDLGSAKNLARHLGVNLRQLYEKFS